MLLLNYEAGIRGTLKDLLQMNSIGHVKSNWQGGNWQCTAPHFTSVEIKSCIVSEAILVVHVYPKLSR